MTLRPVIHTQTYIPPKSISTFLDALHSVFIEKDASQTEEDVNDHRIDRVLGHFGFLISDSMVFICEMTDQLT
jgi:hypothetical protein